MIKKGKMMSFKKDIFFSGLRSVLALDANRIAIGEVVIGHINDVILPELEELYRKEDDFGIREEISEQIELWELYGDRKTSEGKSWSTESAKMVASLGRKYRMSIDEQEELASLLTYHLLNKGSKRSEIFGRLDLKTGPLGILRLLKNAIKNWTVDYVRAKNKQKETSLSTPIGDGGSLADVIPNQSVSDLDNHEIAEVKKELFCWMNKNTHGDLKDLFNIWFEVAKKNDASNIKWSKDIFPQWADVTGKSATMMDRLKKPMYQRIVDFLEDEIGLDIGIRELKKLKLAKIVEMNFWRKRLANWILGSRR